MSVHLYLLLFFVITALVSCKSPQKDEPEALRKLEAKLVAKINAPVITEASGMVVSRVNPNLFWLQNDSGDKPCVYGIDTDGNLKTTVSLKKANIILIDCEGLAWGQNPETKESLLYVGDIGDNNLAKAVVTVLRLKEPHLSDSKGSRIEPDNIEVMPLKFPGGPENCEALLVHPETENVYLISKQLDATPSKVYKARFRHSLKPVLLEKIATLKLPSEDSFNLAITGGDISQDGRRVILSTYGYCYQLKLPFDCSKEQFDRIWKQEPEIIKVPALSQSECVCYSVKGEFIYITSEGKNPPLYRLKTAGE